MNFRTNKEKGNTGLGIAIAYYTSNGYQKIENRTTLNLCNKYEKYRCKSYIR